MKKNVYKSNGIALPSGGMVTRYDVDVDTLTEECDWKSYKRMANFMLEAYKDALAKYREVKRHEEERV